MKKQNVKVKEFYIPYPKKVKQEIEKLQKKGANFTVGVERGEDGVWPMIFIYEDVDS